jgi:hypothetical protein
MKTIQKIQTFDGVLHDTHGGGRRHLEKMLGNVVSPLAHRLHQMNFAQKQEALAESEVDTMREIIRIVDDLGLEPPDED